MSNGLTLPLRAQLTALAPLPLRAIVGYGFMEHGLAKLFRGPDAFAMVLHAIGVPVPYVMSAATIAIEVFGGLLVLVGAFISLAAVPMVAVLLVATFTVHLKNGFSSIKLQSVTADGPHFGQPGFETDLLYLACIAALLCWGPGRLALGPSLRRRLRSGHHLWVRLASILM